MFVVIYDKYVYGLFKYILISFSLSDKLLKGYR